MAFTAPEVSLRVAISKAP